MPDLTGLSETLREAAEAGDEDRLAAAADALCRLLDARPGDVAGLDLSVLATLRDRRKFTALRQIADCLNGLGHPAPEVRLALGQALIDTGAPSTAIDVLHKLAGKSDIPAAARIEAAGLTGRAFKDLFLRSGDTSKRREELLTLAVDCYRRAFDVSGESSYWAGENLLALLVKAREAGMAAAVVMDPERLAGRIDAILAGVAPAERRFWHWATLGTVAVSRADWAAANDAFEKAVRAQGVTPFALEGTIRQLRLMWGMDRSENAGILVALQARKLQLANGHVAMSAEDMATARTIPEAQFEKIFGAEGPKTHAWMKKFLDAGTSVCLISRRLDTGMGTGFIVDGGGFHASLEGQRLILTNDHVVSPEPEKYQQSPPLRVGKADMSFELQSRQHGECRIDAAEIVWSSGAQAHDACLIRLAGALPEALAPLPVTDTAPVVDPGEPDNGVYVIGHPGGRGLSYSMQNNELLDHDCPPDGGIDPRRIHYVTPTEPGSSGSPAMNAALDVIGLHHAGAKYMSPLNGKTDTYPANEAIWIRSIREAARSDMDAGRNRWAG